MNIPDFMPRLRRGTGQMPKDGGCLIQVAGYLNDGVSWTDQTPCVHPMLRTVAIGVNDSVSQEARQGLLEFVPRLIGTTDNSVTRDLVTWCMDQSPNYTTGTRRFAYQQFGGYFGNIGRAVAATDVAALTFRDIYDHLRGPRLGPFGDSVIFDRSQSEIDAVLVKFLGDMIDAYDEFSGREVTGKTVTDEDWKRVSDVMKADA